MGTWTGQVPLARERGINVLLLTVLGIVATLVFLGVGIAPMLGTLDATNTAKSKTIMASDITVAVHQYIIDRGSLPVTSDWTDVLTALPGYFRSTPCDPADSSCKSTSSTSDYQIYTVQNSSNYGFISDYTIMDTVSHPAAEMKGLANYTGVFGAPGTSPCTATSCNLGRLFYRGAYSEFVAQ